MPQPDYGGRGGRVRAAGGADDQGPWGVETDHGPPVSRICVCGDRGNRRLLHAFKGHGSHDKGIMYRGGDDPDISGGRGAAPPAGGRGAYRKVFRRVPGRGRAYRHIRGLKRLSGCSEKDPEASEAGGSGDAPDGAGRGSRPGAWGCEERVTS